MANFCIHSKEMAEFIEQNWGKINAPFTAGIELTAKCNLNCVHCYAQCDRNHKDMSTEEIKNIIDILVERGLLEVFFTGGEVFIREDFEEIYIYTKKKGVSVVILSNITLLNQHLIELFTIYPVQLISTTMYGYTEEVYEQVTQTKGSYKKFMGALELLKVSGIRFELKFVAMKQNIRDLYKVRKLGVELGVDMIIGLDIRPMSDGNSLPVDLRISAEEAFEFDMKDKGRREFWTNLAKELYEEEKGIRPKRIRKRFEECYLYPCLVAFQFVFITSDCKMQGCIKTSYVQYDLKNGSFDDGWKYLQKKLTERKASDNFQCVKCDKSLFCEQCTANFALEYNDEEIIDDFYCQIAEKRKKYVDDEKKKLNNNL